VKIPSEPGFSEPGRCCRTHYPGRRFCMDDRKLEEVLKAAKVEQENFFEGWDSESLRNKVRLRIQKDKSPKITPHFNFKNLGIVMVCILIVLWLPYTGILKLNEKREPGRFGTPITQQAITLDDNKPKQLINFFSINNPDLNGQSLMAVLWGVNPDGNYKAIYSSLFEDSDLPHPVSILNFPGTQNRLAIISSGDSLEKFLHYRLIGYRDHAINIFIEENYVPHGKLSIKEGMLVEQRTAGDMSHSSGGMVVTYIIPYMVDTTGELILSTDHVQLNVGEQLLLIGCDSDKEINFYSKENLIKKIENKIPGNASSARFNAQVPGEDNLLLTTNPDKNKGKNLSIKVVEGTNNQK